MGAFPIQASPSSFQAPPPLYDFGGQASSSSAAPPGMPFGNYYGWMSAQQKEEIMDHKIAAELDGHFIEGMTQNQAQHRGWRAGCEPALAEHWPLVPAPGAHHRQRLAQASV